MLVFVGVFDQQCDMVMALLAPLFSEVRRPCFHDDAGQLFHMGEDGAFDIILTKLGYHVSKWTTPEKFNKGISKVFPFKYSVILGILNFNLRYTCTLVEKMGRYCWWWRNPKANHRLDVQNPVNTGISTTSTAGLLPSTVCGWDVCCLKKSSDLRWRNQKKIWMWDCRIF